MSARNALLFSVLPCLALAAGNEILVRDPYVRLAPPNAPATGAFMQIHNNGSSDMKLVMAKSPVARSVELHTHKNENGVMKMREVPAIEIKAKRHTELKPGSFHVMLIGMTTVLKEGDLVPITLRFNDGSEQRIEAPVRKLPMGSPQGAMNH